MFFFKISYSQRITTNSTLTPQQLIEGVLVSGCVEATNATSTINGNSFGIPSFARFDKVSTNFPFASGIVISTGNANSSGNTINRQILNEGTKSWGTDSDLESILGVSNTLNATTIEFDFISLANTISFNYLFASEEYDGVFPCEADSDSFVFLIKEVGSSEPFKNIAVIPGTTIPVNIGNIHPTIPGFCESKNEDFFGGFDVQDTNFNGRTAVMTATTSVIPNKSYHIKLIIADQKDEFYDSAVFIEANSFTTPFSLGDDVETCESSFNLSADLGNPSVKYSWFFNGTLIPSATTPNYTATASGIYKIKAEVLVGAKLCLLEDEVNVVLNKVQKIDPIQDYILCDLNNPGDLKEAFDLESRKSEIIELLPKSDYEVGFFYTQLDAEANRNSILSPVTNRFDREEIFVRVEDLRTSCISYTSFFIEVESGFEFKTPTNIVTCESQTIPGYAQINLATTTGEIQNGNSEIEVAYYISKEDADLKENPLELNYWVKKPFQKIYASISLSTAKCDVLTSFDVTINSNPILVSDRYFLDACDNDNDGFAVFNIKSLETTITAGLTNVAISYHASLIGGHANTNTIINPEAYTNTEEEVHFVYLRAENNTTGCYSLQAIELHTDFLLTGTKIGNIGICDDSSKDEKEVFDFEKITEYFIDENEDITIKYYLTEEDRDNDENELDPLIPYQNISNPQKVFINLYKPTCHEVAEFDLVVFPYFQLTPLVPIDECDTNYDEIISVDLSSYNNYVSNNILDANVTYHANLLDAESNTNPIANNYTNTSNPFTVFARVTNLNGCVDTNELTINVLTPPVTTIPSNIVICDDDQDGVFVTDLTLKIPEITPETENVSVDFYEVFSNAHAQINKILNPTAYPTSTKIIYARVTNTKTQCYIIVELNSIVNTLPVFEAITPYTNCEKNNDALADFFLVNKDDEILHGQTGKTVHYYLTEADANARFNEIDKNDVFTNASNPQTLFVRVENVSDSSCFGISSFQIRVSEAPIYNKPLNFSLCDTGVNDGKVLIDLNTINAEITKNSPQVLKIAFFAAQIDAFSNQNSLPTLYTTSTSTERIFVRIENEAGCLEYENFLVTVLAPPSLGTNDLYEFCDKDGIYDGISSVNLNEIPLSILDVRTDGYQNIYYASQADFDAENPITNPTNFVNTSNPQKIWVRVLNTKTGCYSDTDVTFSIVLPPNYTKVKQHEFCATNDRKIDLSEVTTLLNIDLTKYKITYHTTLSNAQTNFNGTENTYEYSTTNESVFIRIENILIGCVYIDPLEIVINPNPLVIIPSALESCDLESDGTAFFNLQLKDLEILNGQASADFNVTYFNNESDAILAINAISKTNYPAIHNEEIFFRITNLKTTCFSTGSLNVVLHPQPEITIADKISLCLNKAPLNVQANTSLTDTYLWSTGETSQSVSIVNPGLYWVKVTTEFGCTETKNFEIIPAEFLRMEVKHFAHPTQVEVLISGEGVYEYQLDDEPIQDSNIFTDVSADIHKITIYETNGCASLSQNIFVLNYPRYFTPNGLGDASSETWHLLGLKNIPGVSVTTVQIYDRYGRLLKVLNHNSAGWDGLDSSGKMMPVTDYWFNADVSVDGKHFVVRGNFSLIR